MYLAIPSEVPVAALFREEVFAGGHHEPEWDVQHFMGTALDAFHTQVVLAGRPGADVRE